MTAGMAVTAAAPAASSAAAKERERNRRKKERRKAARAAARATSEEPEAAIANKDEVEIEFVPEELGIASDPRFADVAKAFERFIPVKAEEQVEVVVADGKESRDDEGAENDGDDNAAPGISKKKVRRARRQTVAEIKRLVRRPDVVEWVDATAADPGLLIELKSAKNTVPVPRHWSQKRKYLQGKRGIEKPPFELPDFIKKTGITEMRQAVREKEDSQTTAQRARARMQVKLGRIEIDYEKLHNAFFRWQTKPSLTDAGDMYYEGKEFEVKLKEKRPGSLSEELRTALNIPPGAPPPWLINMQRYGPPPAYPNLKIPGLNAPIPPGASWGFQPGGWGKPPVDELGQPLYGDVFGTAAPPPPPEYAEPVEKEPWGAMAADEAPEALGEEEDEEGAEDEGEGEEEEDDTASLQAALEEGLATPSGIASVASGLETPATELPLRKDAQVDEPKALYTVIPQAPAAVTGLVGSSQKYDFARAEKRLGEGVEVALDPSDLGDTLDQAKLQAMLAERRATEASALPREDLSDMVAEHEAKQAKKRKKVEGAGASSSKKLKEFKF